MNAKGGVGKSTLTMAIAECLSVLHGKRILLIDADGQMSLSLMVASVKDIMEYQVTMAVARLRTGERRGRCP